MQYVVVLSVPDAFIEGDDSIEAVCREVNDLMPTAPYWVRPLSEVIAS